MDKGEEGPPLLGRGIAGRGSAWPAAALRVEAMQRGGAAWMGCCGGGSHGDGRQQVQEQLRAAVTYRATWDGVSWGAPS
eukprot:1160097-Pelagomonas_calceolata.AAC.2